jgi:uncharacterized protein
VSTPPIASDIAFTPSVKAMQARLGSRASYERLEQGRGWAVSFTPPVREFVAEQTSFFLGTVNAAGQPYIQHRGGPPGFLRVLDDRTLAFADFSGNRQYISTGNLMDNPRVHVFLIDYRQRRRVKIWGRARIVEGDAALLAKVALADYRAIVERVMVIDVLAWDANCPQHIPKRFDEDEVQRLLSERDTYIRRLETELADLKKLSAAGTR